MLFSVGCYTVVMLSRESAYHVKTEENIVEEEYYDSYDNVESEEVQTVIHEHYYYGDLWPGTIYFDPYWTSPYWYHYSSWNRWYWGVSWSYHYYPWRNVWYYGYSPYWYSPYYNWYYGYSYYDPYWDYYDRYYGDGSGRYAGGTSLGVRPTYLGDGYHPSASSTGSRGGTISKAGENSGSVVTRSTDERSVVPSGSASTVSRPSDSGEGTASVRRVITRESTEDIPVPKQPESSSATGTVKRVESRSSSSSSVQRSSSSNLNRNSSSSTQTSSGSSQNSSIPTRSSSSSSSTRSSSSAGSSSSGSVTRSSSSSGSSSSQSSGTVRRK